MKGTAGIADRIPAPRVASKEDTTPFSEFMWADFLRRRIKRKMVESDFACAMENAMKYAKSQEAIYLPGWCARAPED